jgi:integrase
VWYDVWYSWCAGVRVASLRITAFQKQESTTMPLEMRTQRDGSLRPTWYGRHEINGRHVRHNLFIKIAGTPPASHSLRDEGNGAFERSRATAQAKLDAIVEEARTKQGSARLVEKLYEIKTGEIIRSVLLSNLPEEWGKIARKRKPNDRYASQCKSTLKRFAGYVHQENVKIVEIAQITRTAARSFMDAESKRGVTAKTWNDIVKLLRATFKYLLPAGAINPFSDLPTRETDTVFRKPYSPEDLAAIVDAARTDEFIRPILVTGICTAMRRGDCCLLHWNDVDLQSQFITVKTAKTGQTVSIPIFPMLYDELKLAAKNQKSNNGYVFPEQARMYQENPDGITWRVKKVLAAAGFRDDDGSLQIATGQIANQESDNSPLPILKRGEIHVTRKEGLRRASVRDFHSFRVTWVTLALTAGVPLELVQKVTGHKTTDIVLKHYFQPGREAFRQALQMAMPSLLTNGQKPPKDEMREILTKMTIKTWKRDKTRLEELLFK